ncbi:MAG TPA: hypothetical protein VI756_23365 [Blastocatellia bacterium]
MSVNKAKPHVLVIPEDEADGDLANGFLREIEWGLQRQMQVLPEANGWLSVLDRFESDEVEGMVRFPNRFMVLLIDFDGEFKSRLPIAKARIPEHLSERVFVIGARDEPEDLKRVGLGTLEEIGYKLAKDCREDTYSTWGHDLLKHNESELSRLHQHVRPILFP